MLSKLVTVAISPLGTAIALAMLAIALLQIGRHGARLAARWLAGIALVWLTLWSLPVASERLRGAIEAQAGERDLRRLPTAGAIVVLGGGISGASPPGRPDPDLGRASDRVWHAARLYREGKAPLIVLSGGVVRSSDQSEAEAMRRLLRDLGVPDAALVLEASSHNTASNAARTIDLLRQHDIESALLVTSALHMPRAELQFRKTGFPMTPAPCDFEVTDRPLDLLDWLPDDEALEGSGRAFKELLGRVALGWSR